MQTNRIIEDLWDKNFSYFSQGEGAKKSSATTTVDNLKFDFGAKSAAAPNQENGAKSAATPNHENSGESSKAPLKERYQADIENVDDTMVIGEGPLDEGEKKRRVRTFLLALWWFDW